MRPQHRLRADQWVSSHYAARSDVILASGRASCSALGPQHPGQRLGGLWLQPHSGPESAFDHAESLSLEVEQPFQNKSRRDYHGRSVRSLRRQTADAAVSTSFEPKGVVVTGAGRGVGRAVAVELARPGVTIALLARSIDEVIGTAALVRARGGIPAVIPVDLADPEEINGAVERVSEAGCTIDTLVNNAGVVWPLGAKAVLDPGEWSRAIAINLIAASTLTLAVLPGMLAEGRGRVVNVSGGISKRPDSMIGGTAYVTATTSLEAHTLNLAAALAGTGVTVNAYRQGSGMAAAQGWVTSRNRAEAGEGPHQRFVHGRAEDSPNTPEHSARVLVGHLRGTGNGRVWTASTPPGSA